MTNWRHAIIGFALIVGGFLLGSYGSSAVRAQADADALQPLPPFAVGDTITLRFRGFGGDDCRVEAISGYFVKCQHNRDDNWYNAMDVERIVWRTRP